MTERHLQKSAPSVDFLRMKSVCVFAEISYKNGVYYDSILNMLYFDSLFI